MVIENNSGTSQLPATAEANVRIGREQRVALLQQILSSRTFAKSTRLSQFLEFVCLRDIEGRSQEINEQQIGIHVFGRSPSYNPADDSVVRTQARLLRHRLEEYFEHECPASPFIVTMPKGGYIPLFEVREAAKHTSAASIAGESPAKVTETASKASASAEAKVDRPLRFRLFLFSTVAILLLLLVAGLFVAYKSFTAVRETQAASLLWQKIFAEGRPVMIVPSDDALVLFEEFTKSSVPLDDYLSGNYLQRSLPPALSGLSSSWFTSHQYTSSADLNLAMRLGRIPAARDAEVETRNAHVLRIDDMKSHNVILIGGLAANPWISLFSDRLSFEVNYDWSASQGFVRNKHPAQGEAAEYRETTIDGSRHSYGVLAYLPGISGDGQVLLFEGTGMAGTEAAADFPFNTQSFQAFAHRIGANSDKLPYFEVLLETTSVGGNGPEARVVTYHLIQP